MMFNRWKRSQKWWKPWQDLLKKATGTSLMVIIWWLYGSFVADFRMLDPVDPPWFGRNPQKNGGYSEGEGNYSGEGWTLWTFTKQWVGWMASSRTRPDPCCEWPAGRPNAGFSRGWLESHAKSGRYPLVNIQKTMENHHFQWKNPL